MVEKQLSPPASNAPALSADRQAMMIAPPCLALLARRGAHVVGHIIGADVQPYTPEGLQASITTKVRRLRTEEEAGDQCRQDDKGKR